MICASPFRGRFFVEKNAVAVAKRSSTVRLAVTALNHAYYQGAVMAARDNPFAEFIHWEVSSMHLIYDVCDLYQEHDEGLGIGNYRLDNAPLPHPFCRCNWYVDSSKSLEEIGDEVGRWIAGEENARLDRAFGEWEGRDGVAINSPRNTAQGNPAAIGNKHFGRDYLNTRQKALDEMLQDYASSVILHKGAISVKDIRALTAANNCEYALLTRGAQRMIIRGDAHSVDVGGLAGASELNKQGWRWSAHTHPGDTFTLVPSDGDRLILREFDNSQSVVYNILGQFNRFGKEW